MDETLYKDADVAGATYHYFASPPENGLPTLLFCHGWPSTSFDWRFQVAYFVHLGYGVVAPDMLGYGGTTAPAELDAYRSRRYCKQLVALLDLEKADRVVAIGHDMGCLAVSNLANWYPDRFAGFVFLGAPYTPLDPTKMDVSLPALNERAQYQYGYEVFGHWAFLSSDEERPAEIIEKHLDSLYSLMFSADPSVWKTELCPTGALKRWLMADHVAMPVYFMHDEIIEEHQRRFTRAGIAPSLNWFKAIVRGLDKADAEDIPAANRAIRQPVLLVACTRDAVHRAERVQDSAALVENATLRTFECGHWVQLEKADELNLSLEEFLQGTDRKSVV